MKKNLHVILLAFFLTAVSLSLCIYKVNSLKIPLLPQEQSEVWSVEARVAFDAKPGAPAKVELLLPKHHQNFSVLDENYISGKYGMTRQYLQDNTLVEWTIRRPEGKQALYYRVQLLPEEQPEFTEENAVYPEKKTYPDVMQIAVDALLEDVRSKSADTKSFTHELLLRLNTKNPDDDIQLLRKDTKKPSQWVQRITSILASARIPTRQINLLKLKDGLTHGQLTPWFQVNTGKEWVTFDPYTGNQGLPEKAVVWYTGDAPLLKINGDVSSKVEFSVNKQSLNAEYIAQLRTGVKESRVMSWSLFNLPIQTQNVYKILIMIPLGALLIVVLRNFVGIKSFGTFMPILIALAFRETEILWGVVLFCTIVSLGLMLRFYLEKLYLLLVPRLAAVLIIVVILMLAISLVTHKLGIERGISIALFPIVIIAMTIERMSLVWEELGSSEAFKQGLGSLVIAAMAYLLMTNETLGHLLFVFPELLLLILAITLLFGRYTGYRLTELWRFRALLKEHS